MYTFLEILISFLAAAGLFAIGWLLFGKLVAPVGACRRQPLYVVVPAKGSGDDLEQTVSGLIWLNRGELAALRIVIADAGLNESGHAAAQHLMDRTGQVVCCPLERLADYIEKSDA